MNNKPVVDQIFGDNKAPTSEVLHADFAELIREVDALIDAAETLPDKVKDDTALGKLGEHVIRLSGASKQVEKIRKDEGEPLLAATREINAFFNDLKGKTDQARRRLEGIATDYQRAKEAAAREEARRQADEQRKREEAERRKAEEAAGKVTGARAEGRAEQAASIAERHEERAAAKPADLVRTNVGGVTASAKKTYAFDIENYAEVQNSLGPLGPYLARPAVEAAIRSLMRIHKASATLPGVRFYEDTKATFRR